MESNILSSLLEWIWALHQEICSNAGSRVGHFQAPDSLSLYPFTQDWILPRKKTTQYCFSYSNNGCVNIYRLKENLHVKCEWLWQEPSLIHCVFEHKNIVKEDNNDSS